MKCPVCKGLGTVRVGGVQHAGAAWWVEPEEDVPCEECLDGEVPPDHGTDVPDPLEEYDEEDA
jgi:hypothetical protein